MQLPAFPRGVYWSGWAADLLRDLIGGDYRELRPVWSTDPEAPVHPHPMSV